MTEAISRDKSEVAHTWIAESITSDQLKLQLIFDKVTSVSPKLKQDKLRVTFLDK